MQYLAIKNAGSFPCISVYIDDEIVFSDIIKDSTSDYIPITSGSFALKIFDNREKLRFDSWLSAAPNKSTLITVKDNGIFTNSAPFPLFL